MNTTDSVGPSPHVADMTLFLVQPDHACPDWCVRTDHDADQVGKDDPPIHYGPEFGAFWIEARGSGTPNAVFDPNGGVGARLDAGVTRRIAADALAATEWLEAHL